MSTSGKSRHSCWVPDLSGESLLQSFLIECDVGCGLFENTHHQVEEAPFQASFAERLPEVRVGFWRILL